MSAANDLTAVDVNNFAGHEGRGRVVVATVRWRWAPSVATIALSERKGIRSAAGIDEFDFKSPFRDWT